MSSLGNTQRGRWNRVAIGSAAALVVATSAGVIAGFNHASPLAPSVAYAEAPPGWADGLDHVMVFTKQSPTEVGAPSIAQAAQALEGAAPADTAPATVPVTAAPTDPPTTVAAVISASGHHLVVHHADGSTSDVEVAPQQFREVAAETDAERAALANAAATNPMALLVEDHSGAVGAIHARYVLTAGALEEVAQATPATTTAAAAANGGAANASALAPARPLPAAPAGGNGAPVSPADKAVLEQLSAVPGVQSVTRVVNGTFAVRTSGSRDGLSKVPGVVSLAEDLQLMPFDDSYQNLQWALANRGAADQANGVAGIAGDDANVVPAWTVSKGSGITVAVIDTGVDSAHPDLSSQMWVNSKETCGNGVDDDHNGFIDDCNGYDFAMNDANPTPDASATGGYHGTHVAGIVAAAQNTVGVVGAAPLAKIMSVKVADTTGALSTSAIYAAIVYATDNGAKVINMSLGTSPGTQRSWVTGYEAAVKYAVDHGVTVVAAAGNNGVDIGAKPVFPANFSLYYPGVITVGASTNSDTKASFSNYGSPVNVNAPGQSIISSVPGSAYGFLSGTSMATPLVAGAVADVLATGSVSVPGDVRDRLVSRAKALSWGPRLDVGAAVGSTPSNGVQVFYDGADTLRPDTAGDIKVRVEAANLPAGVTGAKVSVATINNGVVYAVGGLPVTVKAGTGASTQASTATDGSLVTVPLDANTQVNSQRWQFGLNAPIPAGSYAVVTELVDATGTTKGGAFVGYIQVADSPVPTPSTIVATSVATSPVTTVAGATTTVRAPTTTVPSGATTTTVRATATTAPSAVGPTTTVRAAATTTVAVPTLPTTSIAYSPPDVVAPGPTTTVKAVATTPATTAPGATTPAPTTPSPTTPATTVPAATTTVKAATTTTPATTVPANTTPVTAPITTAPITTPTTTPTPPPDQSGQWRLDSMTPRIASNAGGVALTLSGAFPTNVPVYVWFGTLSAVIASSDGATLTLTSPTVTFSGSVDVSVRFTSSTSVTMTLTNAFTFNTPTPSTTVPAATTTTVKAATTTTVKGASTTVPAGVATTVVTGTTTPGATTTTTRAATTTAVTTTTVKGVATTVVIRGNVQLRPPVSGGVLSKLNASSWPTAGCTGASCAAASV